MKKLFILLFTLLCLLTPNKVFGYEDTNLFNDSSELLAPEQRLQLEDKMETVSDRLGVNIVIVTTNDIGNKSMMEFADDYYDNNYSNPDGIILVINMGTSEWYVSTAGNCIDNISDYEIDYIIGDYVLPYLQNGDFYSGFDSFVDGFDYYFYYDDTADIEENYEYEVEDKSSFGLENLGISGIIGAISSFITSRVLKGQLKSTAPKRTATNYSNNFVVTGMSDFYLGSYVSKTKIIKNKDISGGNHGSYGSGHSSHTSSSGVSHGGHGGHF